MSEDVLTFVERKTLEWLTWFVAEHGYGPSIREIGREFKVCPNAALARLKRLEKKGFVRRTPKHARAIGIVPKSREA